MSLKEFITKMPKVELHVHLEGAIEPTTLLKLAKEHKVKLPANTVEGLQEWYKFKDFPHFVEIYLTISSCLKSTEDIELITREFLIGQAKQNIRYSEVTYTAYTHYKFRNISFEAQLSAINRARDWAKKEYGITMALIIDIPRSIAPEEGLIVADWVIDAKNDGVVALGLGGPEVGYPPELHKDAFKKILKAGITSIPHAGETMGAESIWGALKDLGASRIGHGVRCLEDTKLVDYLREHQVPLEVCPTSNICLQVAPSLSKHPLPKLLEEGLYITINSDDPPMFNTTLTDEFLRITETFAFSHEEIKKLVLNALNASLLLEKEKKDLLLGFEKDFQNLTIANT
ncbi:MAG: adenosine deaminase [Acidobacteria bacterium]|nr:adenosine deaminase [Acidobacteriota bacterium]